MFVSYSHSDVSSGLDNLRSKIHSRCAALLPCVEELKKKYQSFIVESDELQGDISYIRMKVSFLLYFVKNTTKLEYVFRIQLLVDELRQEVHSLYNGHADSSVSVVQLHCTFSSLQEKMSSVVIDLESVMDGASDSGSSTSETGNIMVVSYSHSDFSSEFNELRSKSYSRISALFSCVTELEKEYQTFIVESEELQDHLWSIKTQFYFLLCFVEHSTKLEYLLLIQQLVDELSQELHPLCNQQADSSVSLVQLNCAFSRLREKMSSAVIDPETRMSEVMDSGKNINDICSDVNNLLLRSLGDSTAVKANCIPYLLEEIREFKQMLTLLLSLFHYLESLWYCLFMNVSLTCLLKLLCRAVVIFYSCLVEKMDQVRLLSVKVELRDMLKKIDVREIYMMGLSANCRKVRENECTLLTSAIVFLEFNKMPHQNHQCEKLLKVLKSLKFGIQTILEENKRKDLHASVEKLIWLATPILYLCNNDTKFEANYIEEADQAVSQVWDQLRHIDSMFGVFKLHKHPKTHPLGFVEFFCSYIKEIQESRAQQIESLKDEIQALYYEFNILRSCLRQTKQPKDINDLQEQIMSLAYDALYDLDFFLVYGSTEFIKPSFCRIRNIVTPFRKEMEALSTGFEEKAIIFPPWVNTSRAFVPFVHLQSEGIQITEEAKRMPYEVDSAKITSSTSSIPTQVSTFSEISFVGFKDEVKRAMESLTDIPYENHAISIVGMPGIGKTTLANKLYEHSVIRGHFDVRVWCTVSQTYRKRELWHNILHQVSGIDAGDEYDDEMIAEKIAQSLKRRRYLIVIDDMWDIQAWKDLRRYLSNDSNGSRALITTRHHNVAEQTASISSNVYNLRLFNEEESFELFERKIGSKGNYPQDLLQIGHQIALRCQGLPLAISVIAGLVSKIDRKVERWKEIAESLTSCVLRDPERPYRAMLEWSYNYLPNHLKPCFLYAGALGACKYIHVWKLKLLWIAEGLVQSNNCENLETRAEEYLMDLISRSLITPTHNKSIGGVKACVMHDLLRDYCAEISEEESFMHMFNMDSWSQFFGSNDQVLLSQRGRFGVWLRGYDFLNERPSSTGLGVQSLLCFYRDKFIREHIEIDVSLVCLNFKLLRVLNIDELDICKSIDRIILLIHLRYLAVRADLQPLVCIPSAISSLWNLQSLIVKSSFISRIDIVDVPDTLWDMTTLRNVHIDYLARFHVENSRSECSPFPENIETLSKPCFSSREDAKKVLGRLGKLLKLSCTFLHCWDDSTDCYQFPIFDFLTHLVSLKVVFVDSSKNIGARHEFSFPSNLKKLSLSTFTMMSWDEMSNISKKLPNLQVLKIHCCNYGDTWDASDVEFPSLKYLKLSYQDFTEWIASEESFPKLEQLHLKYCQDLEEIPPCFEEAPCLQMISLEYCSILLCDSARRIEKSQKEEAQNSEFRVDIRLPDSTDSESEPESESESL